MRTQASPNSGTTRMALWIAAKTVSVAGVALALSALALAAWQTLGRFDATPLYFIVREWAASPTTLLLVFTIIWIERLVTLHRGGHSRLVRLRYSSPTIRLIGRASQWLGLLGAWISSSVALQRLTDLGVTAALIIGVLTFGLSMWLLEGLSFRQALSERRARSEGLSESGPVGC